MKSAGKIAIVDDNPSNLKVLYTYLKDAGFEVLVAEDGTRGIEVAQHSQPELILLDVMMPGIDGFEVCRRFKTNPKTQHIPVIFLTALSETVDKVAGFAAGGVDYITQPIANEEVVARVKTHLEITRMRQQLQQKNIELQAEIERRKEIEAQLQSSKDLLQQNNDNLSQTVADRTAQLHASDRDLEHFAYIASHDLRQPLRKIRMCSEYLAEDCGHCLDSQAEKYLGYIMSSIDRMYLLIDDLLTYSRIGRQEENYINVDFQMVVVDTLEDLGLLIAEKQAKIKYDKLPTLKTNLREIRQLFQNLIGNALKFTKECSPSIQISARQDRDYWLFTVKDNGIGIEPQYSTKIFQMFQRLHHSSEYEGTGIGLAICHKIVTNHGGEIWVESELGKGAKFYFTLPALFPTN